MAYVLLLRKLALFICIFILTVFYHTMDMAPGCNTGVTPPGVRADNRAASYPSINKRHQGLCLYVRYHLSSYLTTPTQDTKHRSLQSASIPFNRCFTLFLAPILPLAAYVCLIDFNRPAEDIGNVFTHYCTDYGKGPVYPLAINPGLMTNRFGTQPMQKPPENIYPFAARQTKWKAIWQPFVSATAASQFPSSYKINLFKRTSGTCFLVLIYHQVYQIWWQNCTITQSFLILFT